MIGGTQHRYLRYLAEQKHCNLADLYLLHRDELSASLRSELFQLLKSKGWLVKQRGNKYGRKEDE